MISSAQAPEVPRVNVFAQQLTGEDEDEPELDPLDVLEGKYEPMLTCDWFDILQGDRWEDQGPLVWFPLEAVLI